MPFIEAPFWASRYGSGYQPLRAITVVVTPPTEEPVTVQEAKSWMGITSADGDATIAGLITSAREQVEKDLNGACLATTVLDMYLDRPPNDRVLEFQRWPLQTVASVKSYSLEDVEATVTSTDYYADTTFRPGRLVLNYDVSWPTGLRYQKAMVVRHTCGFTPATLPEMYRLAVKTLVKHWFDGLRFGLTSSDGETEIPLGYSALLSDAPVTVP